MKQVELTTESTVHSISEAVSTEAFAARHSLMGEKMMEDMGKSCVNVAVLQRRYAKLCLRLKKRGHAIG